MSQVSHFVRRRVHHRRQCCHRVSWIACHLVDDRLSHGAGRSQQCDQRSGGDQRWGLLVVSSSRRFVITCITSAVGQLGVVTTAITDGITGTGFVTTVIAGGIVKQGFVTAAISSYITKPGRFRTMITSGGIVWVS